MKKIVEQFREAITEYKLLEDVKTVYIALSGGPDSIVLLDLFCQEKSELGVEVKAIHIHHGLRKVSDDEAVFVSDWCAGQGIECHVREVDVKGRMDEGHGMEEAARLSRYEVFEAFLQKSPNCCIALGHHRDDQVETVLMNFLRGSGLKGLGGMLPQRQGYIRPLLSVSRDEIIDYCRGKGLPYITDESNSDTTYRRNKLRHEVIPYIESALGNAISDIIGRSSKILQEEERFIHEQMLERFGELNAEFKSHSISLDAKALMLQNPVLGRRMVRHCIGLLKSDLKGISMSHVEAVLALIENGTGKGIDLPDGIRVTVDYGLLIFRDLSEASVMDKSVEKGVIQTKILEEFKWDEFPKKNYTKWFDYDKIRGTLVVRTRRNGDYIRVGKTFGKKKLKDFFMDIKMPRDERDTVALLADEEEVLWIIGHRINDRYKVTEGTTKVLEVQYKEDFPNER